MKRLRARYNCGVELAMDVLGGKWKPVILARLKEQPARYGDLRRMTPAISDKVLTQRIHDLEDRGLIAKRSDGCYALTERGESLRPVLQALYDWGEANAADFRVRIEAQPID